MQDADGNVAELVNQGTDQGSPDETFDSLPDLLPYIFQSQDKSSAPDLPCLVTECSTYKFWESCTTDVIPLASQIEEAEHWRLTGTHTTIDDNLQSFDSDNITMPTRIAVRENLRRVQAFPPQKSILCVEQDISRSEDLQGAHDDVTYDAAMESERQPDSLDTDGDTGEICADCYLIVDEAMTKKSPFEETIVADVTCDAAIEVEKQPDSLNIGGNADGNICADCPSLDGYVMKESPFEESPVADETEDNSRLSSINKELDDQEKHVDKHPEVKKRTKRTLIRTKKSPFQASGDYRLDFPKEIRKQKRSISRRREGSSASINSFQKMYWLSDTDTRQDHLERDQSTQVAANPPNKKKKRTSQTRKNERKSVFMISGRQLLSEPPTMKLQPSGRQGTEINLSGTLAELKQTAWKLYIHHYENILICLVHDSFDRSISHTSVYFVIHYSDNVSHY